jgi:ADP-ribose pyrophosphatase YjhB (NUDIX family)
MKYCSNCGEPVIVRIPAGDNRERHVCETCDTIHYQNPKIVAGCVPVWYDKILLCRRAIEPRYGLWTLPAGFMENGESTIQAAARETREEANAIVENLVLYGLYNLIHINQVYLMFRGDLKDGQASAGEESLEVDLFSEPDIPWRELAFPVVRETLERYFEERRQGVYQVHAGDIIRKTDGSVLIHRHN